MKRDVTLDVPENQTNAELLSYSTLSEKDIQPDSDSKNFNSRSVFRTISGGDDNNQYASRAVSFVEDNRDRDRDNNRNGSSPIPSQPVTPKMSRKFTTNSQYNSINGNVPGTSTPIQKRITDSRRNSGSSFGSGIRNRFRRKSILISSNVEVEAIFELTPEQLAHKIDHYCRFIFPGSFFLFNVIYWVSVLIGRANSMAPKW